MAGIGDAVKLVRFTQVPREIRDVAHRELGVRTGQIAHKSYRDAGDLWVVSTPDKHVAIDKTAAEVRARGNAANESVDEFLHYVRNR